MLEQCPTFCCIFLKANWFEWETRHFDPVSRYLTDQTFTDEPRLEATFRQTSPSLWHCTCHFILVLGSHRLSFLNFRTYCRIPSSSPCCICSWIKECLLSSRFIYNLPCALNLYNWLATADSPSEQDEAQYFVQGRQPYKVIGPLQHPSLFFPKQFLLTEHMQATLGTCL